jgi:5-methylcytosine-specific restriction enzyme A
MSTSRAMRGGWVDRKAIPRGPNGRGICRWCSLEVPRGRYTFCSAFCVHEWKLRTQPAYLREQVLKRDCGICATCGIDTVAEARRLRYARGSNRTSLLDHWGLRRRSRKSLWDADHIVPVVEGGGECDLENIRTLCLRCHRQATLQLRKRKLRLNAMIAVKAAGHESLPL